MSLFDDLDWAPEGDSKVTTNAPQTPAAETGASVPESQWQRLLDKKDGKTESTLNNARVFLKYHPDFRGKIRWNEYAKKLEVVADMSVLSEFYDQDPEDIVSGIQDYLAHQFDISVSYSDLTRRVMATAKANSYDPLNDHLLSLAPKWDGEKRIDNFFMTYFGAGAIAGNEPTAEESARNEHLRRIGRRWLLGAIERALRPGCKVDNILILEGLQGARKTSALEALGGEFYCSTKITLGDKDSKMIAASNWFVDMPDDKFMKKENRGFITTREDTFRPPFGAAVKQTKRRCVFIGSMNDYQYFEEEERRYWPVRCEKVDLEALMRDRDQIWAEAVSVCLASETCLECQASKDTVAGQRPRCEQHRWWLDSSEEKEALVEAAERVQDIPWKLRIQEWWLDMDPSKRPPWFTVEDVAVKALKIEEDRFSQNPSVSTSIGIAVRSLGFLKNRIMISGVRHWVYKPSDILARQPKNSKPNRSSAFDAMSVIDGGKR